MDDGVRFVGRADELVALADVLARADGGRIGAVVTVVGEPGAGKTALVDIAVAGRSVSRGRAREGEGAPPLWLWEQVLGQLGETLPSSSGTGGTGMDRFRTFDALARRLVERHRSAPLTIVLDDLQWADRESLAFLDFLAPDAEQHGIVVLTTVRRGELRPLPHRANVIELGGLAPHDVALLITPNEGAERVDPDLVDAVWRHTGGNPFFIGEVDRLLRTVGHEADPAHWRGIVPEGVRSVLLRRLARLPQRANRTLMAAAELGESIELPVLAAVLERAVDEVVDDLGDAAMAGLVVSAPDGRLSFAHSLIRETAREELRPGERMALNRLAAHAILAAPGEPPAGQIARHLMLAGDPEASAWAVRAGESAFAASMYTESAQWFTRALEHSSGRTPDVRLRRAEALARCGQPEEAEAEFMEIATLARQSGDAQLLARAALGVGAIAGGFEVRQLDPVQQGLLVEAIDRLTGDDSHLLAALTARLSVAMSLDGDHAERSRLADEAIAMARRVGDGATIGAALGAWCDAHAGPGDVDGRRAAATEMLLIARRLGDAELELLARRLLIVATLEAGDIGLVERHSAAFSSLADRLRAPQFTWYARLIEGMLALLHGNLERAEALALEAGDLGRQAHSANALMLADGSLLPAVHREMGRPDFLDRMLQVNAAIPEATRGHDLAVMFRMFAVGYGATPDSIGRAIAGWAEWWRSAGPDDGLWLCFGFHLARGAALVGDAELIAEVEAALAPHADRFALDGTGAVCHGPISGALAALAGARGDRALADQLYRRAIDACRRLDAPLQRAMFERELAAIGETTPATGAGGVRRGTFRRDGDVWLVGFAGRHTRLRHTKGMADIATLLEHVERDVHVFDLVGASAADRSDAGAIIDATAKAAYRRRIDLLADEIEAAAASGHDDRAAALDSERADLIEHLAGALGLGGRQRVAASDVERARKAVGMRVRDALRRIDRDVPELGRHLRSAVRTGTWCSYRPDSRIDWELSPVSVAGSPRRSGGARSGPTATQTG